MGFEQEFAVVDIVLNSGARTMGVDALTLSIVKMERQIRRLFTYLVYQSNAFGRADVLALRAALEERRDAYFPGFITGIDALVRFSVADLVGNEYAALRKELKAVNNVRNKLFHGQLTKHSLRQEQLLIMVGHIRRWCELLASGAQNETKYDGFDGNSFRKGPIDFGQKYRRNLMSIDDYKQFIREHVVKR